MKTLIILATLFASTAFAGDQYVKLGDIKGEAEDAAAPVIDNEENAANDVKESAAINDGEGTTGQARRRADVTMKDVSTDRTITNTGDEAADEINGQIEMLSPNLENQTRGARDYNSSRSNKRGARGNDETHTGTPKSKRKLDTDDDDDSIETEEDGK